MRDASPSFLIARIFRRACCFAALGVLPLGAACSSSDSPAADEALPPGSDESATEISDGAGDAGAPSTTDPSGDENLLFIQEDGFQTTYFALDCRSMAEDGSVIDGATGALPVGAGNTLVCELERFPSRATTNVLSTTNEVWCALGELEAYQAGGDERLTISITTPPDVAPAVLIATREGEAISLMQATAFGGRIWPLWIEASYDVNEVAPAEQGKSCDEVFGL